MASLDRQAARRRGRWAETAAAWRLRLAGFRILARGYVTGRGSGAGEVDIVARRGRLLVFVEVKQRADLVAAAQAVGPRQQGRIARAAQAWLARHPALSECDVRFDAVLVAPWRLPVHIADAWRMDA
ncbi:MAG: YraN family protein [Actinomycetota bacterium]